MNWFLLIVESLAAKKHREVVSVDSLTILGARDHFFRARKWARKAKRIKKNKFWPNERQHHFHVIYVVRIWICFPICWNGVNNMKAILIGWIARPLKNKDWKNSKNFNLTKTTLLVIRGYEYLRSLRNDVHFALNCKFSNVKHLQPVQEEVLLKIMERKSVLCVLLTGCAKSLIFYLVPLVSSNLHKKGLDYPKKPILLMSSLSTN